MKCKDYDIYQIVPFTKSRLEECSQFFLMALSKQRREAKY